MRPKGTRPCQRLSAGPPSAQKPSDNLAPRDAELLADALVDYHALFADLFARREQRQWSQFYLQGLLSDLERKSIEPMVLARKGDDAAAIRAVQQFLGEGAWDDEAILARHQQLVADSLGEPDGIVLFDGSGFPKQGTHSVGVARQYCGALGKTANCQQGVFAAYLGRHGYTFLDRRLYVPQKWFEKAHQPLRKRYGVPADLHFQTEPALALEMLQGLVERGAVPFGWVVADEHYGMVPSFLDGVAALGKCYFAEVPVSTQAWVGTVQVDKPNSGGKGRPRKHPRRAPGQPKAEALGEVAQRLSPRAWRRYTIKEGSKGPIEADFAFLRVTRSAGRQRPGARAWAVFRRSRSQPQEIKIYLSNAPAAMARTELVRLSGSRWPVESAIEEAKGELGMDHYETRTWRGWHHHMTEVILAHHFLVRLRLALKKSSGAHAIAGPAAAGLRLGRRETEWKAGAGDRTVSAAAELRGVPLASEAHGEAAPAALPIRVNRQVSL